MLVPTATTIIVPQNCTQTGSPSVKKSVELVVASMTMSPLLSPTGMMPVLSAVVVVASTPSSPSAPGAPSAPAGPGIELAPDGTQFSAQFNGPGITC